MIELYHKNYSDKKHSFIGLFEEIKKKYNPKRVLYPGCFVHITPSLVFSDVTYVDSLRNTDKFFKSEDVGLFIDNNKRYAGKTKLKFYHQDYTNPLEEKKESFDVVFSLYGGFVGQAVKKYLKSGGILVCNDSHGDASMASIDSDYQLVAVYDIIQDDKVSISDNDLERYLIPKRKQISKDELLKTMRGVPFTKSPSGYIFKKI